MKFFFSFIILLSLFLPLQAKNIDSCLAKSKDLFNEDDKNNDKTHASMQQAKKTLYACLKMDPDNTDALISLAGVEMVLGNFKEAKSNFQRSLQLLPNTSPYYAYIYSRLGDIAMHTPDLKEAEKNYLSALKYEPANINSLVGAGICAEKTGRIQTAADYYKKALAVDFTNIVARDRLIALEPDILSEEELIRTMKERNIIDPAAKTFSAQDKQILEKIIKAEKGNGIEYLSKKFGGRIPNGFTVERDSNKVYARKMLTLTGYNELIAKLSHDAKQKLINNGVSVADLFKLYDANRKPLFNDQGNLTDEGLVAFTKMLNGEKSYFRPGEKLPPSNKEIERKVQEILNKKYIEILTSEYAWLQSKTRCSEKTLKRIGVKDLDIGNNKKRYFVFAHPEARFPYNMPYLYIQDYRTQKQALKSDAPVYSNTFGLGNTLPEKLCDRKGNLTSISQR